MCANKGMCVREQYTVNKDCSYKHTNSSLSHGTALRARASGWQQLGRVSNNGGVFQQS